MPKYFIGNILSPTETQPEADDPTFAFTREESQAMSMKDIPIRMEHHPDMEVGHVTAAWRDPTGVYILGSVDANTMTGTFARKCIGVGDAYYGSLSLAHEHLAYPDGSSRKRPVEVSLCQNPRRPGCTILWVGRESISDKYKEASISSKMADTKVPKNKELEQVEELKAILVKQEAALQEMEDKLNSSKAKEEEREASSKDLQTQLEEAQEKLKIFEQKAAEEEESNKKRAEAIVESLKEHWGNIGVKVPEGLQQLATSKKSADSLEFLRLCHQASTRYASQNSSLRNTKVASEVEQHVNQVDADLNPAKRKRPNVMDVLSKYKSSSGAIGLQREIYNSLNR